VAFELAARADVVIENFLPGVAARLGLGYDAVRAAHPPVVYASVTGFGQDGPYARRPGYNSIAQGMSGLMGLTGMPGHPPTRVGGSVSDLAASLVAFGAINAALVQRFRGGVGQHLDVNLLASTMALLPDPAALYFDTGVRPRREGNRNVNLTPAETFPTADGLIMLVMMNPEQWDRFCRVLGDEELRTAARFADNDARLANHAEMRARVEAALAHASTAEWVQRFAGASIACGPVYEFDEVFEDPQVQHLGTVIEVDQPGWGKVRMIGFPYRGSQVQPSVRHPAPGLGEHTAAVLRELGRSRDEIERLVGIGAVAVAS
jgi:crotonobetainyl-CoA:carnitine CoA-transferase CaiB-like acyl-CoA transferase